MTAPQPTLTFGRCVVLGLACAAIGGLAGTIAWLTIRSVLPAAGSSSLAPSIMFGTGWGLMARWINGTSRMVAIWSAIILAVIGWAVGWVILANAPR